MPDFIKNNKDEKRWQSAKKAVKEQYSKSANPRDESRFTNEDWALTNHIYQNSTPGTRFKRLREKIKRGQ